MSTKTVYGIGGYRPAHPSLGRTEFWDGDNPAGVGTLTRWDDTGTQIEQRPLTAVELVAVNGTPEAQNRNATLVNIESDIAAMQAIIDTTNATLNAAQVAPYLKDLARAIRRLDKHTLNDFEQL
jgi:hypothetical protein